jgi:formiminotetrahydrofolate cyclodeaminase
MDGANRVCACMRYPIHQQPLQAPTKRKKQPNEPRQPDTAYICFWKSRRPEVVATNPLLAAPLVSKEVGKQWRALSEDERHAWEDMAAQDKLRFQEEIMRFQPTLVVAPKVLPSQKVPLKDPFAPKPAKTGFQFFMSHNRETFTLLNMTINEFRAEMSQLWKRLPDADKNEWYELAKQDERRFKTEMNAYKPPAYMETAIQRAHKRLDELKRLAREDSSAPHLPMNAYNFYLSSERRELASRRPDLKNPEIMREIGMTWRAVSEEDRAQLQSMAEEDVERFRSEMEAYLLQQEEKRVANADRPAKRRTRKRKEMQEQEERPVVAVAEKVKPSVAARKRRKLVPPRRPKTAYNLMYMSKRAELLEMYHMSHNECSALCGRLWRQLPEDEREPYKRMAAEDKLRYEAELKIYNAQVKEGNDKMQRDSAGFRYFLEAKQREDENVSEDEAAAIWRDMSAPHQLLWTELAQDNNHAGAGSESERHRQANTQVL